MKHIKILIAAFILTITGISCTQPGQEAAITSADIHNPATAASEADSSDVPRIKFYENMYDFGIIIQGEKVSHIFKFKNEGKSNLIVSNASASCGCTIPKFSTDPIKPGQEGEIEVIFNSSGRMGRQSKSVYVYANTYPNKSKIEFTAEIIVPEKK